MSTQVAPIVTHAPTRPLDVLPEIQQVARRGVSIVSIYPNVLFHMLRHNGTTMYKLAEPRRGSYSCLVVYDTQQWIRSTSEADGIQTLVPGPIPAQVVAVNLVNIWAGNTIGERSGHRPGIAIIAGEIPTAEELAALHEQQNALFNWYIVSANDLHIRGQSREIVGIHRMAAKYLLDKGAERLPWYPKIDFAEVKDCIACGKQIYAKAIRCEFCTTNLVDWYVMYGLDPHADAAVEAFMKKMNKPTPAQNTAPDLAAEFSALKAENDRLRQSAPKHEHPVDPKAPRLAQS